MNAQYIPVNSLGYKVQKFIYAILPVYLTFIGFSSIQSIDYSKTSTEPYMEQIPAYIIPEQLEIMTWYDPEIDERYLKKLKYLQILKFYKKSIMKAAKDAATDPFDNMPGMIVFIEHLKFMRDYYANGYNVWAMESENRHSRQEGIEAALTEFELGYDLDWNMVYNYFDKKQVCIGDRKNSFTVADYDKPLNGLTYEQAMNRWNEEAQRHKRMFYNILLQEFETWWD